MAYSVAIANEKLIFNPASLMKRKPENHERVRFLHNELNNDEEERLVAVVADRIPFHLPMLLISIHTGMRGSVQIALKWPDIGIARDADGQNIMAMWKTKPGRTRRFPVNAVVLDCLEVSRERAKGHIVLKTEGNPVKTPRDWLDPCVKLAGPEDYTWHCNRLAFASRLVMAGVDLATVSKFMGHSTIPMTMRCAHLAPDHPKASVEKIVLRAGPDSKRISRPQKRQSNRMQ